MTKTKARERLRAKGSNFGTYTYKYWFKISDFIIATSFKIKVFLMFNGNSFLQIDVLILTFNFPYLFVIGIVTSDTFCGIYILSRHTFNLFSVF